jgi:hypothetical protein
LVVARLAEETVVIFLAIDAVVAYAAFELVLPTLAVDAVVAVLAFEVIGIVRAVDRLVGVAAVVSVQKTDDRNDNPVIVQVICGDAAGDVVGHIAVIEVVVHTLDRERLRSVPVLRRESERGRVDFAFSEVGAGKCDGDIFHRSLVKHDAVLHQAALLGGGCGGAGALDRNAWSGHGEVQVDGLSIECEALDGVEGNRGENLTGKILRRVAAAEAGCGTCAILAHRACDGCADEASPIDLKQVAARFAFHRVEAHAGVQRVVACACEDHVVACASTDAVRGGVACDGVGQCVARAVDG